MTRYKLSMYGPFTVQFPDLFNDFIRNNPVAASLQMKNNQRQLSITELKEALSVVPEFREQKKKVNHI